MDQKLQQKIKELAQPTLDSLQLPSPVTGVVLESVSFGQSPPYIEGCRTLREKWAGSRDLEVVLVNFVRLTRPLYTCLLYLEVVTLLWVTNL